LREHGAAREAERAVVERVMALSAAHDVLSRESWTGANLGDLVHDLMSAYDTSGRITAAGPALRISPKSAIALALALQELAAHASTHGALSTPEGRVELSWNAEGDKVALEWRETGGPPASPPAASGFAAFLLGRMLTADLGEPAQVIEAPEGLICRIRAPAMHAGAGSLGNSLNA
jgi:two-component sensor histidine kinase